MAAVAAAEATLKALREGTAPAALPGVPAPALVRRLSREDDYARRTADWLGG
jgi:carboxyvinyl-carboxyphosphonate phosphorylmutase